MIRLSTLDEFAPDLITHLTRTLFQSFGVGSEYVGNVAWPAGLKGKKEYDAMAVLDQAERITAWADDKVVYLTERPLAPRESPAGKIPTQGFADVARGLVVLTSHGLGTGETLQKRLGRQLVHDIGRLWGLHHCLDPRCAMHPPWTPASTTGDAGLCTFCREKSEKRIRLAKT